MATAISKEKLCTDMYSIILENVPKYFCHKVLKKKMQNINLKPVKIVYIPGRPDARITFKNQTDKEEAMVVLPKEVWKGNQLFVKDFQFNKDSQNSNQKILSKEELLNNFYKHNLPLKNLDYCEQLKHKNKVLKDIFQTFHQEIIKINPYFMNEKEIIPESMIGSPLIKDYRNKCEFSVGPSIHHEDIDIVGYRACPFNDGHWIIDPSLTESTPKTALKIVEILNHIVRNNQFSNLIFDRIVTRTTNNDEIMVIMYCELQENCQTLKPIFDDILAMICNQVNITSLYIKLKCDSIVKIDDFKTNSLVHFYGKEEIIENLFEFKFLISPESFFQINTSAMELLIKDLRNILSNKSNNILLDLCCGTGVLGILLSKNFNKVFGIELLECAINDAKKNCQMNGIDNCEFVVGKVETTIFDLINNNLMNSNSNVTVIIDPPRAGLNAEVMRAIRKCEKINKVLYISCKPEAAKKNFTE